jgi:excisionase family DNA binding protein
MPIEQLFKVDKVSELLAISKPMVWKLISLGKLKTIKIGHSVRIAESELEKFLKEQEWKLNA